VKAGAPERMVINRNNKAKIPVEVMEEAVGI
jgi:hypothetical protein